MTETPAPPQKMPTARSGRLHDLPERGRHDREGHLMFRF